MRRNEKHHRQPKFIRSLYFEKQKTNDSCRVHAINNALGRSLLTAERFLEYCDEFDKRNRFPGSREFFFVHKNDSIFTFILNELHVPNTYYPPDSPPTLADDSSESMAAVMIFDDGHIWSAKKHDEAWYVLDSVSNGPKLIEFERIFDQQGFGWIVLWENGRASMVEQSDKATDKHRRS